MIEEGYCEFCKFFKANLGPIKGPDGFCLRMPPALLVLGKNNLGQISFQSQFPPVTKAYGAGNIGRNWIFKN